MPGSALLVRARHDRVLVEDGRMLAVIAGLMPKLLAREAVHHPGHARPGGAHGTGDAARGPGGPAAPPQYRCPERRPL